MPTSYGASRGSEGTISPMGTTFFYIKVKEIRLGTHELNIVWLWLVQQEIGNIQLVCKAAFLTETDLTTRFY